MKVLDLFSGIGGFSLGLERAGMRTIAFCEIDSFCQKVLRQHWRDISIVEDVRNLSYKEGVLYYEEEVIYTGGIDIVCGGFPCQPFSIAGRQEGTEDNRDLWPEMFRVIQEVRPTWVIGENVANFTNMALTRTEINLESEGYEIQSFIIPACSIGAPHRRDRIWIIAYTESGGYRGRASERDKDRKGQDISGKYERGEVGNKIKGCGNVFSTSDSNGERFSSARSDSRGEEEVLFDGGRKCKEEEQRGKGSVCESNKVSETITESAFEWCRGVRRIEEYFNRPNVPESLVCRDGYGFSRGMDRIKALGNAVVPQIPEIIGRCIMESERIKDVASPAK